MYKFHIKTQIALLTSILALSGVSNAQEIRPINFNEQTYYIQAVYGNYATYQSQIIDTPWYNVGTGSDFFTFSPGLVPNDINEIRYNIVNGAPGSDLYLTEFYYDDESSPLVYRYGGETNITALLGFSVNLLADENLYYWLILADFIGPSAADTLASMQPNASAMKNAFNSQYATLAYGLNHDCTIYDTNGVCVSVFGRSTSLNDSAFDNNAAGLILGYKPHAQFRIGTYIDQSLNSNKTSGVKVERSNPDVGVFGVWNMNADGSGLELRAAANYGKRDVDVTRSVVGTAEAGNGKSDLNAYGALLEASYAYAMNDSWTAKPYAGVRYLSIKRDSYTEATSDAVQNPLNYSGLKQETTSAIAGVRFNGRLAPKVVASLNAGLEHDLHHSIDDYRATGVDGLGSIDMNSQKDKTRPTAGVGIAYDVADKQRLSANVQYRKEIFMSESSTTGQVTYTIGF